MRHKIRPRTDSEAVRDGIPAAPALAEAAYGDNYDFREGITELGLRCVADVRERTAIWEPGESPLPAKQQKGKAPACERDYEELKQELGL